ncbi:hypothetical protein L6R52_21315, partial [Myxococcota bacterium]|nr:hypothetical protein [Myxococcota bacterium]
DGASDAKLPAASGCAPLAGQPAGFVTMNSRPYADVFHGERLLGQTPLPKVKLPAGCAELRFVNPETKKEKTVRIDVASGMVSAFEVEL